MADHPVNFVVIGLGNFGSTVATELKRFGNYVIGIDIDEGRVTAHADLLDEAMIVDARSEDALREAGIAECEVGVIALGQDLETSVLATMNLKTLEVEKIWAKAESETHHRILERLGVDRVIHPEVRIGEQIAQMLHNPLIGDYIALSNSYHMVNMRAPEDLSGKSMQQLELGRFDLRCLGVMRGEEFLECDSEGFTLQKEDILLILGGRSELRDFAKSL